MHKLMVAGLVGLLASPVAAQTLPLTRDNGAPVGDNQNSKVAGPEGPVLLEDLNLIEKLARFDRERAVISPAARRCAILCGASRRASSSRVRCRRRSLPAPWPAFGILKQVTASAGNTRGSSLHSAGDWMRPDCPI
jgi:hypothetical protein